MHRKAGVTYQTRASGASVKGSVFFPTTPQNARMPRESALWKNVIQQKVNQNSGA